MHSRAQLRHPRALRPPHPCRRSLCPRFERAHIATAQRLRSGFAPASNKRAQVAQRARAAHALLRDPRPCRDLQRREHRADRLARGPNGRGGRLAAQDTATKVSSGSHVHATAFLYRITKTAK
eukprot:6196380-Pleurochrysis_carterae.AAC.1